MDAKCPHCGGTVPTPGFFSARKQGLAALIADLIGHEAQSASDVETNVLLVRQLRECTALAADADVFLRPPLNRLQDVRSLAASGVRNGRQYASTLDVSVDASHGAKLDAVAEVLRSLRALLENGDPEKALVPGCDPCPQKRVIR
jgi:hypothetical protein